jgi:YVTN family beta-propeller protein
MLVVKLSRVFPSLGVQLTSLQRVGALVITGLLLTTGLLGVVAPAARADTVEYTFTGFSGPYGVAVNPLGTVAYVPNIVNGTVSVVNLSTYAITATIAGFDDPYGVAVNPAGTLAYVTNFNSDTVSVVSLDQLAAGSSAQMPDKMQAVPRPSTGCATFVSDASINWFGIAGTGWNPSWAQWPNNGLGGDVCVRMLGYNTNTSRWVIR